MKSRKETAKPIFPREIDNIIKINKIKYELSRQLKLDGKDVDDIINSIKLYDNIKNITHQEHVKGVVQAVEYYIKTRQFGTIEIENINKTLTTIFEILL